MRADRNACGLNSLTLVLAYLSGDPDQGALNALLPMDRAPFSFADLENAARRRGYKTYLVHWNEPGEASFACPAILHIRANTASGAPDHFLACFGETAEGLCVAEFPYKPFLLPRHRLEQIWEGDVLYVEGKGGIVIRRMRRELLWSRISTALAGALAVVLIARLGIEVWRAKIRRAVEPTAP